MIYAVCGQTGSGKSYYTMRKVVQWLEQNETNQVVTNLPIDMGELCAYMTREHGDTQGVRERVRILSLQETAEFWLHPGVGLDLDPTCRIAIPKLKGRVDLEIDYTRLQQSGHRVLFALDESDEIYDAKAWGQMGGDLGYFCRHQRKWGFDIYFLAPSWSFLVKEIRVLCHAVWIMENGAQMKLGKIPFVGSLFRGVPWITGLMWKVDDKGNYGGQNVQPRDQTRFRPDPDGIGKCYRTEDGLGVTGNREVVVKAEKSKGLHPVWIGAAALLLVLALLQVPKVIGKAIGGVSDVSAKAYSSVTNAVQSAVAPVSNVQKKQETNTVPRVSVEEDIYCTGIASLERGRISVFLSNGNVKSSHDRDFQGFAYNGFGRVCGARFGGKVYRFKES